LRSLEVRSGGWILGAWLALLGLAMLMTAMVFAALALSQEEVRAWPVVLVLLSVGTFCIKYGADVRLTNGVINETSVFVKGLHEHALSPATVFD
jgi:hypothetical protein